VSDLLESEGDASLLLFHEAVEEKDIQQHIEQWREINIYG
jgi:hypothetical protein